MSTPPPHSEAGLRRAEPAPRPTLLSREEEAEQTLGNSEFGAGARALLVGGFLAVMLLVPVMQVVAEARAHGLGGRWPMLGVLRVLPSLAEVRAVRSLSGLWALVPHAERIKAAEKQLEKESVLALGLRPRVQEFCTGVLGAGSEQALPGSGGWLFYRPDVEYVTGPAFLDGARQLQRRREAGVQPDPMAAIVDFRDQLKRRGIELWVVPVPVKPCVEGRHFGAESERVLHNASFGEFCARMERAGVRMFDVGAELERVRVKTGGGPLYLEADTHWRPETMRAVAEALAVRIDPQALGVGSGGTREAALLEKRVSGMGDTVALLGLASTQTRYRAQEVTIWQVPQGSGLWRPSPSADVLLLGDSFANLYSMEAMGWGEGAGFAEHLSRGLGRPVDAIVRNSDGAFATRELLARELRQGRDRLAGKKVVVWEFAARELAFGDWKLLALELGQRAESRFLSVEAGREVSVEATVASVSVVPRPGSVPYSEHILTAHLVDLASGGGTRGADALVCVWSMRGQQWTAAARWRAGDRVRLRVRAWGDVAGRYEKINRSELSDAVLQLEEPLWGELEP